MGLFTYPAGSTLVAGVDYVAPATAATFKSIILASPAANTSFIAATGLSLTGSNTQSFIDLAGTWNTGSTVQYANKTNVTDTASGALSRLESWQVGGVEKAGVVKDGAMFADLGIWKSAAASYNGSNYHGIDFQNGGATFYAPNFSATAAAFRIGLTGDYVTLAGAFANGIGLSDGNAGNNPDAILIRAAAATLQFGLNHATAPVAQVIQGPGATSGNNNGASVTIKGGAPDGSGTRGSVILQGGNRAALVADATDEASAITLVNALKAAAISHGLMAAS